jgi:hypothetical protein
MMRNLFLCLIVLALDTAFCLIAARVVAVPGFDGLAAGVPVAVWAGAAGLVFLMALTWLVSLFAFGGKAG